MTERDWNAAYESGGTPWDTGIPDAHLARALESGTISPGRVLEIGCGTGTNAIWLCEQGFDVIGVDIAPLAIERARTKAAHLDPRRCSFKLGDFLRGAVDVGSFDLVFDRGCFHVFDGSAERAAFATRVASVLAPTGTWISLIGSSDRGPNELGPPGRSAREVVEAVEPVLELVELRSTQFYVGTNFTPKAWICIARPRKRATDVSAPVDAEAPN